MSSGWQASARYEVPGFLRRRPAQGPAVMLQGLVLATLDEDHLPFVEQGHHQNLWFCRICWLVERIPSHVWQLVTITCSDGHLAGLLDWSFSLRPFLCCSCCCLRKLGSIQKWVPWELSPPYSQRCGSACVNTPAWGLYNLVEGL